jgi:hypothetical protein
MKKIFTFGMVLIAMMISISSAAAQDTVTRDLPESADAGATITVDLTVDTTDADFLLIDEVVPAGWTVVNATNDGDCKTAGHVFWAKLSGVTDAVYSYTIQIPAGASGTYIFNGTYMFDTMDAKAIILGETEITVGPPESPRNEVYFDPERSSAPSNEIAEVEIRVNVNESFQSGQLNVTYPSEYANVTDWALNADDFSMGLCTLAPGRVWITFVASGPLTGEHTVGTLTVQRVEDACHTAELVFGEPSLLCDDRGQEIEVEWNGGIFTCDGVCGDVTGDGVVDIMDVTLLLNYVNLPFADTVCEWCGDVTGDGAIDIRDVTLLLNHVNNPTGCPLCCR